MFTDQCNVCLSRNICISATRLVKSKREFLLSLNNQPVWNQTTNQLFKEGKERHRKYQEGTKEIKTPQDFLEFRKLLYRGEKIKLVELKVCSSIYGHGIIDSIILQYNKDNCVMDVWVEELKSNFSKQHILQLLYYCLILSDTKCNLVYEQPMIRKKKKNGEPKTKRLIGPFHHRDVREINIKGRIFILTSNKEQPFMEIVVHNQFVNTMQGLVAFIAKRRKDYGDLMKNKVIDLTTVKYCNKCYDKKVGDYILDKNCGWVDLCSKIGYVKDSVQKRIGVKKLLVG